MPRSNIAVLLCPLLLPSGFAVARAQGAGAAETGGWAERDTTAFWMPQTREYEAFLREGGHLRTEERHRLDDPRSFMTERLPGAEWGGTVDTLAVRLAFIDATKRRTVRSRLVDEALFDLNGIFGALPRNPYRLEAVSMCASLTQAPKRFSRRRRGRGGRGRDGETDVQQSGFDFPSWLEYLESIRPFLRSELSAGEIPVFVITGGSDVLGFTLGTPTPRWPGLDAVVVSGELLRKDVRGREGGKALAHLVANHLGLRSLWVGDADGGDFVDDTPAHNAPNLGTYPDGVHFAMAPGLPVELVDNVMDNTDDAAGATWTRGQVTFLTASLLEPAMRGVLTADPDVCPAEGDVRQRTAALQYAPPEPEGEMTVDLSPNPARDRLLVRLESVDGVVDDQWSARIYDHNGRLVQTATLSSIGRAAVPVDIRALPAGSYTVAVATVGGQRSTVSHFVKD